MVPDIPRKSLNAPPWPPAASVPKPPAHLQAGRLCHVSLTARSDQISDFCLSPEPVAGKITLVLPSTEADAWLPASINRVKSTAHYFKAGITNNIRLTAPIEVGIFSAEWYNFSLRPDCKIIAAGQYIRRRSEGEPDLSQLSVCPAFQILSQSDAPLNRLANYFSGQYGITGRELKVLVNVILVAELPLFLIAASSLPSGGSLFSDCQFIRVSGADDFQSICNRFIISMLPSVNREGYRVPQAHGPVVRVGHQPP